MKVKMLQPLAAITDAGGKLLKRLKPGDVVDLKPEVADPLTLEGYCTVFDEAGEVKRTLDATKHGKFGGGARPTQQETAYDRLLGLVGNDLVEIFGDYGTGKSRLLGHIALEIQNAKKRVIFFDNENSLPRPIADKLQNYEYVGMRLQPLIDRVANLESGFDLVCVDSIGFPVLCNYFELGLKERLTALGRMILLRAHLKEYAVRNNGLAIATNQPVSEFAHSEMAPDHIPRNEPLPPFGGKGAFISKLLLRTEVESRHPNATKIALMTYKARDLPFDRKIATFTIGDGGTELAWAEARQ